MSINNHDPYGYSSVPQPPPEPELGYEGAYQYGQQPQSFEGTSAAQSSIVLGIAGTISTFLTGLFLGGLVGIILGILGIKRANVAKSHQVKATSGLVLSWISLIFGSLFTLAWGAYIMMWALAASASGY